MISQTLMMTHGRELASDCHGFTPFIQDVFYLHYTFLDPPRDFSKTSQPYNLVLCLEMQGFVFISVILLRLPVQTMMKTSARPWTGLLALDI